MTSNQPELPKLEHDTERGPTSVADEKHEVQETHVIDNDADGYIDSGLVITPEEDRRLRNRIHRRILPFLCLGYLCQALDKGTITTSSIMGWLDDVHATGQDFSLTTTILWCGIILGEPLANQVIRRFPLAKVLSAGILVWSALLFGLGFSLRIPPILAIRFLLGFCESLIGPVLVALTVQWYKTSEQPFVASVWQAMLGTSNIITSLLAYGFYHIQDGRLKSWQWLHIAIATVSVCCSVIVFLFLPSSPTKARWATEHDKSLFVERVRSNNQGLRHIKWTPRQAREAFTDPFTYCLFFLCFFNTLCVGGISTFGGLLITRAFGFTTLQAQLLNIPVGVLSILSFLGSGWICKKTGNTCYTMIGFTIPNIVGTVVLLTVAPGGSNRGPLIFAYYLMQLFGACYPAILTLLSRNCAGQSKRSIVYATTFIGWAGGNGISPQIFQAKWAPRYFHSLEIHIALYGCFIATTLITRTLLVRRNREKIAAAGEEPAANLHAFDDLTDLENPDFRYSI